MRKQVVILGLALLSCIQLTAQKSQQEIYLLAERATDYSYDQLLDFADEKLDNSEDIARFFYYWIGQNVTYDLSVDAFELNQTHYARETEPQYVFNHRKATCLGFNNLYASFLDYFGITHKTILGYTRHRSNVLKNIAPALDHVWSAIYINDQWHLTDVTWSFAHIQNPESRDHYFMTPPHIFRNDHLPLDAEWFLDGHEMSLEDFHKQPLVNPSYYGISSRSEINVKMEVNELGETVLYFPTVYSWRFSLAAVNQSDEKDIKLKYKMRRVKRAIQFTLKNYEPGMTLRLDATRRRPDGVFLSLQGLVYLNHPKWQEAKSAPFRQFSTKKDRFKK